MTAPEVRAGCEFRVAGRTLSGRVMTYGDISPEHGERFLPGAFGPAPSAPLNIQHDRNMVVLGAGDYVLSDTPRALEIRAELPAGSAAIKLVRRGALNGYSVEFHARQERREAGVRVIERAALVGIGLVDAPSYPASKAEVRARSGRTLRQRIFANRNLGCQCAAATCKWARLVAEPLREAIEEAFQEATEILAVRSNYGTPLASKSRGSVRATMDGDDAVVEVDLPDGPDGASVLRDIENTGAVLVRPYLDADASEGEVETLRAADGGNVMVYRKIRIRSFVVGATDSRDGWPAPELVRTRDDLMPDGRAAPAPERRRRWWP